MAKVYMLTEDDFERLLENLQRDPKKAERIQTSLDQKEALHIYDQAYRMYKYVVWGWIKKVKEE